MADAHVVTIAAVALSILCFVVYVIEVVSALLAKPTTEANTVARQAAQASGSGAPTLDQLSKLLEAISMVTDSLAKAGPSLTSLIASVLFLAIATASSGAFQGSSPPRSPPPGQSAPPAH